MPIYSSHQRGCVKPCQGSGPSCSARLQELGAGKPAAPAHPAPETLGSLRGCRRGREQERGRCSRAGRVGAGAAVALHLRSAGVKPTAGQRCPQASPSVPKPPPKASHQGSSSAAFTGEEGEDPTEASPQSCCTQRIGVLPVPGDRGTAASWCLGTATTPGEGRKEQPCASRALSLCSCFIPGPPGARAG